MNSVLQAYMGWSGDSHEAACLIFARTAREAKVTGYPTVRGWDIDCQFTDMRVRRLRGKPHLFDLADPAKLKAGAPHVVEAPPVCSQCEQWGQPLVGGTCWDCSIAAREAPVGGVVGLFLGPGTHDNGVRGQGTSGEIRGVPGA